jgi:RNase P subunit RPR2
MRNGGGFFSKLLILQPQLKHRDPVIKQSICKGCGVLLMPGINSSFRTECKLAAALATDMRCCCAERRVLISNAHLSCDP